MGIVKIIANKVLSVERHNDKELSEYRIKKCESCDSFEPVERVCNECGCYMDNKVDLTSNRNPKKLGRVEYTHCPIGKWSKIFTNIYREIDGLEPI